MARVKAVAAQVPSPSGPRARRAPRPLSDRDLEDSILRARTGQGGEYVAGFSIRTNVDSESRQMNRELRNPGFYAGFPA